MSGEDVFTIDWEPTGIIILEPSERDAPFTPPRQTGTDGNGLAVEVEAKDHRMMPTVKVGVLLHLTRSLGDEEARALGESVANITKQYLRDRGAL